MPEEPYPADIDETTQGHPPEDWTDMYDEEDPDAGREPYPDDIEGERGTHERDQ